jgi:hypothetical protein
MTNQVVLSENSSLDPSYLIAARDGALDEDEYGKPIYGYED